MFVPGEMAAGEYEIIRKIGEGGTSIVYLAMEKSNGKLWAVKEIKKSVVYEQNIICQELVTREADLLTRLKHPALPRIRKVCEQEQTYLIVMEFIEGVSLAKYIEEYSVGETQAIRWMLQLAAALTYLHSRIPQIIYRDMKPGNIMIRPDGNLVLLDFGIAREYKPYKTAGDTRTLGTIGYAAPEQYDSKAQTDVRTDIYCLGVTMHQVITKQDPAKTPFVFQPIRKYAPYFSKEMEHILVKCTQLNPDKRFQSSEELLRALQDICTESALRGQGKRKGFSKKKRQSSIIVFLGTVLVAFAVAAAIFCSYGKEIRYQDYLQRASQKENINEALEECQKALQIFPEKSEPYFLMLEITMRDQTISVEEMQQIEAILDSYVFYGMTYRNCFQKENPEKYLEFCYKAAVGIFFDGEDLKQSKPYTAYIINSEQSSAYDYVTAYLIDTLLQYSELPLDGDYSKMWETFQTLWDINPSRNTYYYIALIGYSVFTEGFLVDYGYYMNAGIKPDQMEEMLYQIADQVLSIEEDQTIVLNEADEMLLEAIWASLGDAFGCLNEMI